MVKHDLHLQQICLRLSTSSSIHPPASVSSLLLSPLTVRVQIFLLLVVYQQLQYTPACLCECMSVSLSQEESRELSEGGCPGFLHKKDEHLLHNPRDATCSRVREEIIRKELGNGGRLSAKRKKKRLGLISGRLINTFSFSFPVIHLAVTMQLPVLI